MLEQALSIEDSIARLGSAFRGLWRSKCIEDDATYEGWAVTIVHDGDYVETTYFDTPHEALDRAIHIREGRTRRPGIDGETHAF